MKTIATIAVVLIYGHAALTAAENKQPKEIAAVLADYNKEFTKAKEPSDKILSTEGSKIVGKLVREARAEEAKLIGAQVEDKLAGKSVTGVHSELAKLFELYDNAVTTAVAPIRERYGKRVDILIKSFEGKDMHAILALSDTKKIIEGTVDTPMGAEQKSAAANSPMSVPSGPATGPASTVPITSGAGATASQSGYGDELKMAGTKLTREQLRALEQRFVAKLWKAQTDSWFFRKDGSGTRLARDLTTKEITWKLRDDGVVEIGTGNKLCRFNSDEEGEIINEPFSQRDAFRMRWIRDGKDPSN